MQVVSLWLKGILVCVLVVADIDDDEGEYLTTLEPHDEDNNHCPDYLAVCETYDTSKTGTSIFF